MLILRGRTWRGRLRVLGIGVLATLVVQIVSHEDGLTSLENVLYDARATHFNPSLPPTTQIVHVDFDDPALEIQHWPWPSEMLAELVDELRLAGAKSLFADILFADPQQGDAELARKLGQLGNVLIPASTPPSQPSSALHQAVVAELTKKLDASPEEVTSRLNDRFGGEGFLASVNREIPSSRREAVFQRIMEANPPTAATTQAIRSPLLSESMLEKQLRKAQSVHALRRFERDHPSDEPGPCVSSDQELPPVPILMNAATMSGFVNYLPLRDGVVRTVPLWINHRGHLLPQAAMAFACSMIGVKVTDKDLVQIYPDRIVVRPPGSDAFEIPVTMQKTERGELGMFMVIPWVGGRRWESMYGVDDYGGPRQHVPAASIWEHRQRRQRIEQSSPTFDATLQALMVPLGKPSNADLLRLASTSLPPNDLESRALLAAWAIKEARPWAAEYAKAGDSDERQRFLKWYGFLIEWSNRHAQLGKRTKELRNLLGDKDVILGFIATGAKDSFKTSVHASCPGAVIHGTIINAIVNRTFWKPAPEWAVPLATVGLGVLIAAGTALLPPLLAGILLPLLAAMYVTGNVLLFQHNHLLLGMAAPLMSILLAWMAATIFRFRMEQAERNQIEVRFRYSAGSELVDYVLDNPQKVVFSGERRVMTVCFSDLQGFTALSEKLHEEIVPVLNEYMFEMVRAIRNNDGFVAKLLGDGVMYFFGAPQPNPRHAECAIRAALDMQSAMESFNQYLAGIGQDPCATRIGIGTGPMTVGDAGSLKGDYHAHDYTVLGDIVNLSARLESVNKMVGTSILVTEETVKSIGGNNTFCFRPIARVSVVGQTESVTVYEPLGLMSQIGEADRRLVEQSDAIFAAFREKRFEDCLRAAERLNDGPGAAKLRQFYQVACRHRLEFPAGPDFDGTIELQVK